jgi:hypothetical protein
LTEPPTGRQIIYIFQLITARSSLPGIEPPAKSGVLRGEQRRSNERRSTMFRRVPRPSGSTMAAATGRSRQPTLAELLAAWSGCVAAVPLDAAVQRTVPKGFGSAALNVRLLPLPRIDQYQDAEDLFTSSSPSVQRHITTARAIYLSGCRSPGLALRSAPAFRLRD